MPSADALVGRRPLKSFKDNFLDFVEDKQDELNAFLSLPLDVANIGVFTAFTTASWAEFLFASILHAIFFPMLLSMIAVDVGWNWTKVLLERRKSSQGRSTRETLRNALVSTCVFSLACVSIGLTFVSSIAITAVIGPCFFVAAFSIITLNIGRVAVVSLYKAARDYGKLTWLGIQPSVDEKVNRQVNLKNGGIAGGFALIFSGLTICIGMLMIGLAPATSVAWGIAGAVISGVGLVAKVAKYAYDRHNRRQTTSASAEADKGAERQSLISPRLSPLVGRREQVNATKPAERSNAATTADQEPLKLANQWGERSSQPVIVARNQPSIFTTGHGAGGDQQSNEAPEVIWW